MTHALREGVREHEKRTQGGEQSARGRGRLMRLKGMHMAVIVNFEGALRARGNPERTPPTDGGEIVLFTGVRYDRAIDESEECDLVHDNAADAVVATQEN